MFDLSLITLMIFVFVVFILGLLLTSIIWWGSEFLVKIGFIAKEELTEFRDFSTKVIVFLMILIALIYVTLQLKITYESFSHNHKSISKDILLPWEEYLKPGSPYYLTGQLNKPNESII